MGSKKLKAVVVRGDQKVPIADKDALLKIRKAHTVEMKAAELQEGRPMIETMHRYGTSFLAHQCAHSGDSPVKNWGGVGVVDYPDVSGIVGGQNASVGEYPWIVLSGGGALIPYLPECVQSKLNVPIEIANPLRNIEYDPELFGDLQPERIAPLLAVGIGLAAREV